MKYCFIFLHFILYSICCFAQTICQTGNENSTLVFNAPVGKVFIAINFASYGTPSGVCGSFSIGSCHSSNSQTIVENALLGNNSATINASNAVFGDPCGGTFKRLYVEAVYGNPLPLQLVSFMGTTLDRYNLLVWRTENEVNAKGFVVERSNDGIHYSEMTKVKCNNRERNEYQVSDYDVKKGIIYYRLKMVNNNGSYQYSRIVRMKRTLSNQSHIVANPVTDVIRLTGLEAGGIIELLNLQGNILQTVRVKSESVKINVIGYPKGIYFVKYTKGEIRFVEKVVVS